MIKNTEVQLTKKDAKLIARVLSGATSQFLETKDDRGRGFNYFSEDEVRQFQKFNIGWLQDSIQSLTIVTSEDEDS